MSKQVCDAEVGGRKISIETHHLARQADGSVLVSCGDDVVLVTAVSAKEPSQQNFFPLTVEYQEKFYSSGRIPGGFFKREGRPSQEATLSARVIDRFIRPCFPEGCHYETQVVSAVLSYTHQFPVEILAALGAASALHISDIPFAGPAGCIQIARVNGEFKANPSPEDAKNSDINLILAGNREGVLMVEGESRFASEKDILSALKWGHKSMLPLLDMQDELRNKAGKPKRQWVRQEEQNLELKSQIESLFKTSILKALTVPEKKERTESLRKLKNEIIEKCAQEDEEKEKLAAQYYEDLKYSVSRDLIFKEKVRIDGRQFNQIRPIQCEVDVLPRVHGSSLFTRGETQILGTVTLGTGDDEQMLDALSGMTKKKFLLHYNFPPFSVGETGRMGGQSRREIGHGFLAEKALKAVIPDEKQFPYTLRIVSEVLESNGSSSMGTVCAGSLALMAGGVPIPCPIAGIAMGLMKEGSETVILSDILGDEDHLGDMDFKVAGSKDGITAVQMDIKIQGLSFDVIEKALKQALEGRLHILDCMNQVLSKSRDELSSYAPRIETFSIHPDKIRDVIGSGGKMINSIIQQTGVKIDIDDNGTIHLASSDLKSIESARTIIDKICEDVEIGKTYEGTVKKIVDFGAFVEILPNTTGLLHISEIAKKRIDSVSSYLKEGQNVNVKVLDIQGGKIRLSMKALL